jgi:multiple sugar transport system substrate-binding protein
VLFYNKDMFKAAGIADPAPWPPMTIDQYVETACKLTQKDKEVWGTANGDPITWLPWEVVVSEDGKKAEGIANGPISVAVHEKVANLFQNGCAPSLNVMDPWQQGVDYFAQGKLAMVITDFQSLFKIEQAKINYGVAHPPSPEGVKPFFNVWTDGIGVFSKSSHPKEAQLFVMYQATEGQKLRVTKMGDFPVSTKVAEEMNWANNIPGRLEAIEVLKHARPALYVPNRWDISGPLFDAFGYIVSKEKTTQAALDEAAPLMQENLDKAWADLQK